MRFCPPRTIFIRCVAFVFFAGTLKFGRGLEVFGASRGPLSAEELHNTVYNGRSPFVIEYLYTFGVLNAKDNIAVDRRWHITIICHRTP